MDVEQSSNMDGNAAIVGDEDHDVYSSSSLGASMSPDSVFEDQLKHLIEHRNRFGQWDCNDVDLSGDREQWKNLPTDLKNLLVHLCFQFLHGEESVETEIAPALELRRQEGRRIEANFLELFVADEARHAAFFRRYLNEVIQDDSLNAADYYSGPYVSLFDQKLPAAMQKLLTAPTVANQVQAFTTYNLVVEGIVAETGYSIVAVICKDHQILSSLVETIALFKSDEARHITYGRAVLENLKRTNPLAMTEDIIGATIDDLLPDAIGIFGKFVTQRPADDLPALLTSAELNRIQNILSQRIKLVRGWFQ